MRNVLTRQWSFFWAGVAFGVAQIVCMVPLWIHSAKPGQLGTLAPITVTTDLGAMF